MPQTLKLDAMTEEQKACYDLLCQAFHGAHHVPSVQKWGDGIRCKPTMNLATVDYNYLTRLVVLAHERCIRVSVEPSGSRYVAIVLHKRQREGNIFERHPTIEEAIKRIRNE